MQYSPVIDLTFRLDLTTPLPMAILDLINRILMDELQTNGTKKDKLIDALLEVLSVTLFLYALLLRWSLIRHLQINQFIKICYLLNSSIIYHIFSPLIY